MANVLVAESIKTETIVENIDAGAPKIGREDFQIVLQIPVTDELR